MSFLKYSTKAAAMSDLAAVIGDIVTPQGVTKVNMNAFLGRLIETFFEDRGFATEVIGSNLVTLNSTDRNRKWLRFTSGTAVSVTIDPDASTPWALDTEIILEQADMGQVTVQGGAGVNIVTSPGFQLSSSGMHAVMSLKRLDTDLWLLSGDRDIV